MIEYMLETGEGYRPGACNIGPAEIQRRRRFGYLGLVSAVLLAAAMLLLDAPSISLLLVALPLAGGLSGLIQAQTRFCAAYGWAGLRNLGRIGDAESVTDPEARAADRRRALAIFAASALGGLLGALALIVLAG